MRFLYSTVLVMFSMGLHAEEKVISNVDMVEIDSDIGPVFLTASKQEKAIKIDYRKKDAIRKI